jgi:hypothetical protein
LALLIVVQFNYPEPDIMNKDIDECIKAVRVRMRSGHTKQQIAEGLDKHFPQDLLFLCYHAATILETAAKEKK